MTIGWYIHHHGRGHLHRFQAVAPWLGGDVTVLSSLPRSAGEDRTRWIELPLDVPVTDAERATVTAGGLLHWAPRQAAGYSARMGAIAGWLSRARPSAVVVDVSVEVALLVRLMGFAPVWVAQRGVRTDRPHQLAFTAAESIIAPWTSALDAPNDRERSGVGRGPVHVGALSRFDDRPVPDLAPAGDPRVCVLLGYGGHAVTARDVRAAARATPGWTWDVTGLDAGPSEPNVVVHPDGCDVWSLLTGASVVVASASGNAVAEVAAARRPLICLPQARPFDEQHMQAAALERAGLATGLDGWPEPERWADLLEGARRRDPDRWALLHDRGGAARFAAEIARVAGDGVAGAGGCDAAVSAA